MQDYYAHFRFVASINNGFVWDIQRCFNASCCMDEYKGRQGWKGALKLCEVANIITFQLYPAPIESIR